MLQFVVFTLEDSLSPYQSSTTLLPISLPNIPGRRSFPPPGWRTTIVTIRQQNGTNAIAGRTPTTAGPLRAWNGNGKVEKREMKFNHFLFLNPAREVWWGGRCSFSRCLELTVKMEYLLFAPFFLCKKSV